MEQQKSKINYRLMIILFFIYEIIYVSILKLNSQTDFNDIFAHSLIFAFSFIIYMIILAKNEEKLLSKHNKMCYLYIGISISIICVFVSEFTEIYHIWMMGCLLISVAYGAYFGIVSTFVIIFMDGLCNLYTPEEYIFYEIIGIILCLLFEFLPDTKQKIKNLISYFYFIIIAFSSVVSLYLITNRLNYILLFEKKFCYILLFTAIMITVCYLFGYIFVPSSVIAAENPESNNDNNDNTDNNSHEKNDNSTSDIEYINYADMLKNDFVLFRKLKNELPLVYKHSLVVADISKKAAAEINADVMLTMVGGMYHEIGKLEASDNFIEKNLQIANDNNFGDKLTNIIMAHNIKAEKPKTKEAAIIYFTENIINTIYYMKNVRKDTVHTNKQIIESFFSKNIKDNNLYESGLSIADYGTLREFYINMFETQKG